MAGTRDSPLNFDIRDVCRRFASIYTGAISDILDEMGYQNQALPPDIRPLDMGDKVTGVALTVQGEPTDSQDLEEIFVPILKMLGDLRPGDVIVTQPNDQSCAHIGELSCEAAKFRGAQGAVIDGGARDTDYIRRLGFPVFCRYRTPCDIVGRWKLLSYGQPIQFGTITIRRGDFVVGDRDGVMVIPQEITVEVLQRAEQLVATEDLVRKAILEGVHPVEAFRTYGRF